MPTVVDTVVLHYFLVVVHGDLLLELLDPPVGVPRIVFDPEDARGADADDLVASGQLEIRDLSDPEGFITTAEANALHTEMRDAGFWDTTSPFPAES